MPVFGIVPYRTEARTRSEARTQAAVDDLLRILRVISEVMWTAEGRLLELLPNGMRHILRPPRVTPPLSDRVHYSGSWPALDGRYKHSRAVDRDFLLHPYHPESLPWGQLGMWHGERAALDYRPMRGYKTWGTIQ